MAEAVATLAVASSVLQVIDFGTKIASTASKIYQASKRDDRSLNELEGIYKNMLRTLAAIEKKEKAKKEEAKKKDAATEDDVDPSMRSLAESCRNLVKELVDILQELGLGEVKTKRKALWVALKHAWNDEKIRSLQARVNEFRSQLTMCLLVSLRQFASQNLAKQQDILKKLGKMGDGPIGPPVLEYVTARVDVSSQWRHMQILETELIKAIQDQREIPGDNIDPPVMRTNQKVKQKSIELFLKSLEYAGMQDREDRIADPHEVTFRWIFEKSNDKWVGFKEWLESDGKLYWITGKAGSGKSTMMRYISHLYPRQGQHFPACRSHKYLEQWAGRRKLIVASFYFWSSALEIQTTQSGLLMTLLRQIFQQCPDLLPLTSPIRWEKLCLFGQLDIWSEHELESILLRCIENLENVNARMALFVDGLDEFSGDLEVLITMFKKIQKLPHNKLCVASRPWNEFRDAFDQNPSLMVEHLTRDDIKQFVVARFERDSAFVQLQTRETEFANQLVEDIVSKSSGVFLWVSLVVSSLISGMSNGDSIADFQRRLDLLPPNLSDLYKKMIEGLDHFYLEQTAQLFALVGASRKPLNLLLASYVDENNLKIALEMEETPIPDLDARVRMDTMHRRINSRSKGLLEVNRRTSPPKAAIYDAAAHTEVTVQYLHRTVKDFMEEDSFVRETFQTALKPTFDPHHMLLAGRLAYMKRINPEAQSLERWADYLMDCFFHARAVQAKNNDEMIKILDNLCEICPPIVEIVDQPSTMRTTYQRPFMSVATACNVVAYIQARGTKPCLTYNSIENKFLKQPWPLLMDAVFTTLHDPVLTTLQDDSLFTSKAVDSTTLPEERYRAMIKVLLENGADPIFNMKDPGSVLGYVSPLSEAAVGYMVTKNELYLTACQLLAENTQFDSTTITCIIHGYIENRLAGVSRSKRFGLSSWSWHRLKKKVQKALENAVEGNPPASHEFWDELISTRLKHRTVSSNRSFNLAKYKSGIQSHTIRELDPFEGITQGH